MILLHETHLSSTGSNFSLNEPYSGIWVKVPESAKASLTSPSMDI